MKSHDRFNWAAQILDIKAGNFILEVGCGVGFAVEEIVPLLTKGKITAIDRSPAMIAKAIHRNQKAIQQGKAEFLNTELLKLSKHSSRYDKIFCFNINFFWTQKSIIKEATILKSLLVTGGLLYIFYGPMMGDGFEKIAHLVSQNLKKEQFKLVKSINEARLGCCYFIASL